MLSEEKKNTALEGSAPRCHAGSKTDRPCWREAAFPRFLDEDELTLCAEHHRVVDENDDLERAYRRLQAIDQWVKGPVAEAGDEDLERIAFNARDEARREYGRIAVRAHAASMVAERGPLEAGGVALSYGQEEEIARCMMREEAFNAARSVLEDVDEDAVRLRDKWATIDALALAADDAAEEVHGYLEELGVRPKN
jgi:hypothetical protein